MNLKRILASVLAVAMLGATAVGCAKKDDVKTPAGGGSAGDAKGPVTLKVWGSQEDQEMLTKMIDEFKTANADREWKIEMGVVGEPDAKSKYLEDPTAAADVFAFANDQILDLVKAKALYEVTKNKDEIVKANQEGAVEASTVDGKMYAYPMTADNGYFMYYDKSVISDEDAKSLDTMLAAADKAGKKVFMDLSNGWYIASFFLGAGGKLGIDANGNQTCDFNNAAGVATGEAIKAFAAHNAFQTGDDAVLTGGMGTTIVAGVTGTWNADAIKGALGDNYAATKLPTFTVDGKQVQMGSFGGYKLMGVNSQTKFPLEAMALSEWLTNEKNQITRFETRAMGPSNINAANSDAVKANVALSALAQQNAFATSQKEVLGNFWTPAEAFGTAMETKDYSKSVQEQLDAMVASIVTPAN